MRQEATAINLFLVDVFNEILKTEETCVADSGFKNLSLREIHVIEAVCNAENNEGDNRATAIADTLRITAGSLTTAVTLLEKKGYLKRTRDEKDKRVVRISSTPLGRQASAKHIEFHKEMVDSILQAITPEEAVILTRALSGVTAFFRAKYRK